MPTSELCIYKYIYVCSLYICGETYIYICIYLYIYISVYIYRERERKGRFSWYQEILSRVSKKFISTSNVRIIINDIVLEDFKVSNIYTRTIETKVYIEVSMTCIDF